MKVLLGIVGTLAGLFVLLMIFVSFDPDSKTRAQEREAIAECRKEQGDELTPIDQRRFIRSVCEHMEAEYRKKWGRNP